MKYIQLLLILSIALLANQVFAKETISTVIPENPEITDALNYKLSSGPNPDTAAESSPSQSPNNRNLASEKKQQFQEEFQEEFEENFEEDFEDSEELEDQDRDVASEQDSANDSPRIRYWKY